MRVTLLAMTLGALVLRPGAGRADETAAPASPVGRGNDADAAKMLGKPPPPLPALQWLDGKTRTLASQRGRVVVIRSFTEGCPFCKSTMPALETWQRQLGPRGLQVLGVYHPKPPRATTNAEASAAARALGVTFPVANDPTWALVKSWWLEKTGGTWTSFTFILDRRGVIRYVHPGGEFHSDGGPAHAVCRQDHQKIHALLERLLAEPAGS